MPVLSGAPRHRECGGGAEVSWHDFKPLVCRGPSLRDTAPGPSRTHDPAETTAQPNLVQQSAPWSLKIPPFDHGNRAAIARTPRSCGAGDGSASLPAAGTAFRAGMDFARLVWGNRPVIASRALRTLALPVSLQRRVPPPRGMAPRRTSTNWDWRLQPALCMAVSAVPEFTVPGLGVTRTIAGLLDPLPLAIAIAFPSGELAESRFFISMSRAASRISRWVSNLALRLGSRAGSRISRWGSNLALGLESRAASGVSRCVWRLALHLASPRVGASLGASRRASRVGRLASGVSRRASRVGRLASGVSRRASRVGRLASGVSRAPRLASACDSLRVSRSPRLASAYSSESRVLRVSRRRIAPRLAFSASRVLRVSRSPRLAFSASRVLRVSRSPRLASVFRSASRVLRVSHQRVTRSASRVLRVSRRRFAPRLASAYRSASRVLRVSRRRVTRSASRVLRVSRRRVTRSASRVLRVSRRRVTRSVRGRGVQVVLPPASDAGSRWSSHRRHARGLGGPPTSVTRGV